MSAMSLDGVSDNSSSLSEVGSGQGDAMDLSDINTNASPAKDPTQVPGPPKTMHKPRAGFKAKPYQAKRPVKKAPPRKKQRTEADAEDDDDDDSGPEYTPRATTTRTRKTAETKDTPTKGENDDKGDGVAHVGKRAVANLPVSASSAKSKAKTRSFAPSTVVTKSSSVLKAAKLRGMLFSPEAWMNISYDQQVELIKDIPDATSMVDITNPEAVANFSQDYLRPNTAFQTDIRLFQEDLANGRFEKDWATQAGEAMEQRASGKFDEWKLREFEAFWGQKQRTNDTSLAGESANIPFEEIVKNNLFRVGDMWEWCHTFKASSTRPKGSADLLMEKEAELIRITDEHCLVFRMAPGKGKFVRPEAAETPAKTPAPDEDKGEKEEEDSEDEGKVKNIEVGPFNSPNNLCTAMMEQWGYKQRISNAWKQIRIKRKNQDIGSPFEIRELYWLRKQGQAPPETPSPSAKAPAAGDSTGESLAKKKKKTGAKVEAEKTDGKTGDKAGVKTGIKAGDKAGDKAGAEKTDVKAGDKTAERTGCKTDVKAGDKTGDKTDVKADVNPGPKAYKGAEDAEYAEDDAAYAPMVEDTAKNSGDEANQAKGRKKRTSSLPPPSYDESDESSN